MNPDRQYYANLFPAVRVSKFLLRHATRVSRYKEMAFRWNIDGKLTWQRFNSYSNPKSMREDLVRRLPSGFYAGPTYNFDPTLRWVLGLGRLRPVEQKLIFDIDLTDYDDIRRCACVKKTSGLRCCSSCWVLAACAIVILRNLLRHKFGFHEFLFTFSGGKGAHCWVLDQEAQSWEDNARLNLTAYFRPFMSEKEFNRSAPMQCSVMRRCYTEIIKPLFEQHVVGHVVNFGTEHGRNLVRVCAVAHNVTDTGFLEELPSIPDPLGLWKYIEAELAVRGLRAVVRSVVMMCTFPRLDKAITTSKQHLIRCPFSINGSYGKLCVPIRYQESFSFSPNSAPDSQTIDDEYLRHYLEVLEEAMTPPWAKLWVCRGCELYTDKLADYNARNIFLSQEEWQKHHETQGHGFVYEAYNSTAKAIANEQYEKPTPAQKKRVFLTLLNIKHSD